MSAQGVELLDLVARWVHVIAGIMWIGNSLLFNWLDRNLRPRAEDDVYGDIWLLHSGGFYLVEKNQGERSPEGLLRLPAPLHWFKWQAYTTWLTGAALLVVVYYMGGRALLVDPAIADISPATGTMIAASTIVAAWLLYEIVWRTLGARAPALASAVSVILLIAAVEVFLSRLSGRAAFLHVGAMLGTIMAANVLFTIVPSQRDLVAALAGGRPPSQEITDRAKSRSIHNNYLTFPVIALMMSAHFPSLYAAGGRGSAVSLFILMVAGAAVRHVLNVRFTYRRWKVALGATMAIAVLLLSVQLGAGPFKRNPLAPGGIAGPDSGFADATGLATFTDARRVIDRRCTACHSLNPSDESLGIMPGGVAFDTPEQIHALAARIRERAVATQTMPPGNKTRMTNAERALLARWIQGGAQMR